MTAVGSKVGCHICVGCTVPGEPLRAPSSGNICSTAMDQAITLFLSYGSQLASIGAEAHEMHRLRPWVTSWCSIIPRFSVSTVERLAPNDVFFQPLRP